MSKELEMLGRLKDKADLHTERVNIGKMIDVEKDNNKLFYDTIKQALTRPLDSELRIALSYFNQPPILDSKVEEIFNLVPNDECSLNYYYTQKLKVIFEDMKRDNENYWDSYQDATNDAQRLQYMISAIEEVIESQECKITPNLILAQIKQIIGDE